MIKGANEAKDPDENGGAPPEPTPAEIVVEPLPDDMPPGLDLGD